MEPTPRLKHLEEKVDRILREELAQCGIEFDHVEAIVYDTKTVGVQGDGRTYLYLSEIVLLKKGARMYPVDLIAKLSIRIPNEIDEINRVVITIPEKPYE